MTRRALKRGEKNKLPMSLPPFEIANNSPKADPVLFLKGTEISR